MQLTRHSPRRQPLNPMHALALASLSAMLALSACSSGSPTSSNPTGTSSPSTTSTPSTSESPLPSSEPPDVATVPTGHGPIWLAATADAIFVELHRDNRVARVDPTTNQQTELLDIPVRCEIATTPTSVWATIAQQNHVTRFDPATGEVLQEFTIPDACGIATDGTDVWVGSPREGALYVLREGEAEPINRYEVGNMPFPVVLLADHAWVAGEAVGGTVWAVDRASGEVTATIELVGADGIAVGFDAVWVTARQRAKLWKLDPSDGSILGEAHVPSPAGVVAVGDTLWVVSLSGALTGLDPATLAVTYYARLPHRDLGPPIYAFGSLWTAALERNVLLRITLPLD